MAISEVGRVRWRFKIIDKTMKQTRSKLNLEKIVTSNKDLKGVKWLKIGRLIEKQSRANESCCMKNQQQRLFAQQKVPPIPLFICVLISLKNLD